MIEWSVIRQEYEQGASLRDIVARHGSSIATISRVARHEGWIRPVTPPETRNVKQVKHETQAPSHADLTPKKDLSTKDRQRLLDRKSTRLNSSHTVISYAVFC